MGEAKSYFFVGIGGSGMLPLAMIVQGRGHEVKGSDRALDQGRVPAKFDDLRRRGIELYPQDGSGITSADQINTITPRNKIPNATVVSTAASTISPVIFRIRKT